jgi:threonine/homoserine/homoserine lactone efflux protein
LSDLTHWAESWLKVDGPFGLVCLAAGAFVAGLSGALSPGPLLVTAIREGVRQGARAGPLLTLGHGLLEVGAVVLIYAGLGEKLRAPLPQAVLALVGGGMLLVMAVLMLAGVRRADASALSSAAGSDGSGGAPPAAGVGRTVLAGTLMSMSNPYWWVWWATIGMGYMASAAHWGWVGIGVFFLGHILSDLAWYWLVTWAVSRGRRLLTDRSYRALIAVCALLIAGFALWFVWIGARGLAIPAPTSSAPAGSC